MMASAMERYQHGHLAYYRFGLLHAQESHGLVQAVFTRHGGVSRAPFATLNASRSVGDDPAAVAENRRRTARALGVAPEDCVGAQQVHGSQVGLVVAADGDTPHPQPAAAGSIAATVVHGRAAGSAPEGMGVGPSGRGVGAGPGGGIPEVDALITACRDIVLWLRFADCVPVFLYDPRHHAVGLAHAGWRGTVGAIAARTMAAMTQAFDSQPEEVLAGIGPAIGPCCYTVSANVVDAIRAFFPWWRQVVDTRAGQAHLNLWEANRRQLLDAGLSDDHIEVAELCTACHTEDFYSHRAEGGHTGRFTAALGLMP